MNEAQLAALEKRAALVSDYTTLKQVVVEGADLIALLADYRKLRAEILKHWAVADTGGFAFCAFCYERAEHKPDCVVLSLDPAL
jgi:hypothetical protein